MPFETEAMANGVDLAQFYVSEAARLANAAVVLEDVDPAERLRRWLLDTWPEAKILPGDVLQRAPVRAIRESPAARAAPALLAKHGWLVALDSGTVVRGKARREAYRIVRPVNV